MSKLTDKMRERGVHNPYEFYGDRPYISFRANQGSRDVLPSRWNVHKRNQKLSDAWYDYGAMSFSYAGRDGKKNALAEAIQWASEKFGIKEWIKDPFCGYGPADFVKQRIKELIAI